MLNRAQVGKWCMFPPCSYKVKASFTNSVGESCWVNMIVMKMHYIQPGKYYASALRILHVKITFQLYYKIHILVKAKLLRECFEFWNFADYVASKVKKTCKTQCLKWIFKLLLICRGVRNYFRILLVNHFNAMRFVT